MNSGKCRHVAEIYSTSKTEFEVNKLGAKVYKEEKNKRLLVQFENKTGSMLYGQTAGTKLAKSTHKISFRYLNFPSLTENHWFVISGQRYNIEYIDDLDNMHKVLEVFVSKQ